MEVCELIAKPSFDRRDHVGLLDVGQRFSARDLMPLRQTSAAAGGRGMLGDEHRMTTKRRLLPVVARGRRRESPSDQLLGLDENALEPTRCNVFPLRRAEVEPSTKG
jgi:hypothetical protein